jgi:hypothetical protein
MGFVPLVLLIMRSVLQKLPLIRLTFVAQESAEFEVFGGPKQLFGDAPCLISSLEVPEAGPQGQDLQ